MTVQIYLPPSSDQEPNKKDKSDKPANTYNGRNKTSKKAGKTSPYTPNFIMYGLSFL